LTPIFLCTEKRGSTPRDAPTKTPPAKNGEKTKDYSKHDDDYKTAYDTVFGGSSHRDKSTERNRSKSPQEHRKEQKKETSGRNKKTGIVYIYISKLF